MSMLRNTWGTLALIAAGAVMVSGCQRPTSASDTTSVDDFVDASAPGVVNANASADGRTYRVARNNESDLIVPYQFKTSFGVSLTLNGNASDKKYNLTFPVTLTQVTVKVNQASGGIVTPPTTGDPERSDYVVTQASGNKFAGANTSVTMNVDVWYTMPSQQKEALITVTFNLVDTDGKAFAKTATINVTP
jgi:hypothetical protein